ncbi:MAG: hypothetical protein HWN66_10155 [Candidatus Helarchaeota archaeon]|nr:hypothetical protein [Candidatus Helarchaeota archaeon]
MVNLEDETKLLYLDQNMWIYLARIYYKVDTNSVRSRILNKIIELVESNKLIVPINLSNVQETLKRRDSGSRERLAEFMIKISKGYTFIPYVFLLDIEIRNLFKCKINFPETDIRKYAIGKGISFLLGGVPRMKTDKIDSTLLEKINKEARKHFDSPEFLLQCMLEPENNIWTSEFTGEIDEMQQNIEKSRKEALKVKDRTRRYKFQVARHWIDSINHRIVKISSELNIPWNTIIPPSPSADQIVEIFHELPISYTNFCLYNGRNRQIHRPIEINDFLDIGSLSFAIPHCDFVVAERFFISIAQNAHLDELYNTVLLSNLEDLEVYLDEIIEKNE